MKNNYYIVHNPVTFNLMDLIDDISTPQDILSFLTNLDSSELNKKNYLDFLKFDLNKQRKGKVETWAMESYAAYYIANQIARLRPDSEVILSDDKRRTLDDIIQEKGKPEAVFITSMSSNFPTAVATSLPLNHAEIPVIVGGIHVSAIPEDVNTFIRAHAVSPELISQVRGAGDSKVLTGVLKDIQVGSLKSEYIGYETIEDGVWSSKNVAAMEPMNLGILSQFPVLGWLGRYFTLNVTTPYLGCPYSCNFCAISSLPVEQRKFQTRSPEDFVAELKEKQSNGVSFQNRAFFFLPDNLLMGGKKLEQILDLMIDSDLKINYGTQVSIEVATNKGLLEKLRESGASHFFIGFESLDLRNLEHIEKNVVKDIRRSGLGVKDYYAQQIQKIQDKGISVHGSFIFGLPYDYFNGLDDHSGIEVVDFCRKHHIGVHITSITDLPGSKDFQESQESRRGLYGPAGTLNYLLSLCICDTKETNRIIPYDSLYQSPFVVSYIAYDTARRIGSNKNALRNGLHMMRKAFNSPTMRGKENISERCFDAFGGFSTQIIAAMERVVHEEVVSSTNEYKGSFERLYDLEKNLEIREMFKDVVQQFRNN